MCLVTAGTLHFGADRMARRNNNTGRRGTNDFASRPHTTTRHFSYIHREIPTRLHSRKPFSSTAPRRLSPTIADNRVFHPLGAARPLLTRSGTVAAIKRLHDAPRPVIKAVHNVRNVPKAIARQVQKRIAQHNRFGPHLDRATRAIRAFSNPLSVPLCHARRVRREVIHALGHAGSGGARPKFTDKSRISCA